MTKLFDPSFPFSPKRFPFFYGWVILVVSTIGLIMSIPGQTIGVSVFTDFLIEALGISRVELSLAYMFGTITSSFFLPWSGRLYDKIGARAMLVFCTALLSLILFIMSWCDLIAESISPGVGIHSLAAFIVVYFGFSLMRFSGQGMLAMTTRAMLGKWFQRKRGFVSGMNGMFAMFFFSLAPLLLDLFVQKYEWRGAWQVMGVILIGMMLLGWLTFRDNPEECDLTMDGDSQSRLESEKSKPEYRTVHEFTYKEALKTYTFWVFNLALSCFALIITAVTFHIVSIGEKAGLDRDQSLFIFFPMAVVSICINLVFSIVSDRVKLKFSLMLLLITLSLGVYGTLIFDSLLGQWFMIVGFGVGQGIFAPLMTYVWPTFFGREHLGAISSFNLSCQVFGSAIGPFLFGASLDWLGDYKWGIYSCLAIPLLILLAAGKADNPQEQFYEQEKS